MTKNSDKKINIQRVKCAIYLYIYEGNYLSECIEINYSETTVLVGGGGGGTKFEITISMIFISRHFVKVGETIKTGTGLIIRTYEMNTSLFRCIVTGWLNRLDIVLYLRMFVH